MTIKTQDLLPGRWVTVHTAAGTAEETLITAADLVGIWAGNTLTPWAAIDRIEVIR